MTGGCLRVAAVSPLIATTVFDLYRSALRRLASRRRGLITSSCWRPRSRNAVVSCAGGAGRCLRPNARATAAVSRRSGQVAAPAVTGCQRKKRSPRSWKPRVLKNVAFLNLFSG